MRTIIFSIVFFLINAPLFSQIRIPLQKENGVYKLSCEINGARMKMILDTGASNVSISKNMARYLFENDYLSSQDIKGHGQSVVATGEIVDNLHINLKIIKIGSIKLQDVDAIVIDAQNAPLLFGLSAIKALGSVTIENNFLIINSKNEDVTKDSIDELYKVANNHINEKKYNAAAEILNKIRQLVGLSSSGYLDLIHCYYENRDFSKAVELAEEWESSTEYEKSSPHRKSLIYSWTSLASEELKDFVKAIKYLKKVIAFREIDDEEDEFTHTIWPLWLDYRSLSGCYSCLEDYDNAIFYIKKCIQSQLNYINLSLKQVLEKDFDPASNVENNKDIENFLFFIGESLYTYSDFLYSTNGCDTKSSIYLLMCAAKCGYNQAITELKEISIDYKNFKYNPTFSYLFYILE